MTFDNLKHGEEMQIERRVYRFEPEDMTALTSLSMKELEARRDKSMAKETAIFDKLCEDAGAWETQAAETMLIDRAIEYVKAKAIEHTGNEWQVNSYGNMEISNAVYQMYYSVYEDKRYDRETKQSVPVAWYLTWDVSTQTARGYYCGKIAGQSRKRFTDKAAMEKYLQGRIKTYSHLFTEISPPIPKAFASYFKINGQLLPGYRVEGQERERPSALDRLAAAKEAVAGRDAEKSVPEKAKNRKRGEAL